MVFGSPLSERQLYEVSKPQIMTTVNSDRLAPLISDLLNPQPIFYRFGRADDMHTRLGKSLEGGISLI